MKNIMFIHAGNLLVDKNGIGNQDRCQNIINEISQL
jgi:hypothetical protein